MIVSWQWISQWVDTSGVDPIEFAKRFTCTVAEIDGVHRFGAGLQGVLVGDVVAVEPHPNADKLRLATVDLGTRQVQVVCGAPDLKVGMRVPFVPPGIKLPSGIEVRDGEVRGIKSPGMLASEADLGLSDDHAGLLSLDGVHAPAGSELTQAFAIEDVLYEVDNKSITHRPDLWGQYGVAREVAAMLNKPLKPLDTHVNLGKGPPIDVAVQTPLCPRYCCARIANLTTAPSPVALRLLLRRLGVRPISNVVDATNLVMLETGNPLHAFDARFVRGGQIRVRAALSGEIVRTLDGQDRSLLPSDLVIADGEGPVALAGIMGGGDSEIREDTHEIILEAAAFDSATVRKTAMRVGLRTESSARFEKALDPELAHTAALRFLRTLIDLCPDAHVASDLLDAGNFAQQRPATRVIVSHCDYLRSRLGVSKTEMPDAWIVHCLRSLEFGVDAQPGGELAVRVPTFRATKDVHHADDLVEELGRHYGYHRIASQAPLIPSRPSYTPPTRLAERSIRAALALQQGLSEVVLYGFDHDGQRQRLGLSEPGLERMVLRNAISREQGLMRRNLAPNLITAVEQNLLRGDGKEAPREGLTIGLFELGRVFVPVAGRNLPAPEREALDLGLPDLASEPVDDPLRQAWLGRLGSEMQSAVQSALMANNPLPLQPIRLGVVVGERLGGGAEGAKRTRPQKAVSQRVFAEVVAAVQSAARALGKAELSVSAAHHGTDPEQLPAATADWLTSWRHPQRWGWLRGGNGAVVGHVTLLHPDVRHALDVPAEVAIAELNLEALLALPDAVVSGQAPARHPGASVDLTVVVAANVRQATVAALVLGDLQTANLPAVAVRFLYEYVAPSGERSLTLRVDCRTSERSLTSAELEAVLTAARSSAERGGRSAS